MNVVLYSKRWKHEIIIYNELLELSIITDGIGYVVLTIYGQILHLVPLSSFVYTTVKRAYLRFTYTQGGYFAFADFSGERRSTKVLHDRRDKQR